VDADLRLDVGERRGLAPAPLGVGEVGRGNLSDRQPVAGVRFDLRRTDQAAQLGLGLLASEVVGAVTVRAVVPWPSREAFLRWGLHECKREGCSMLINPEISGGPLCTRCFRGRRQEKYEERVARRAAASARLPVPNRRSA
jgi:hypothetical protein